METNHEKINVRFAEFILRNYLREYDFFFDEEGKPHSPVEVWTLFKEEQKELENPLYNPMRRFEERQERDLEDNLYKGYSEAVRRDVMNDNPCETEKSEGYKLSKEATKILTEDEACEMPKIVTSQDKGGYVFNFSIDEFEKVMAKPLLDPKPQGKTALDLALEEQEEMKKRLEEIASRQKGIDLQLEQIKDLLKIGQE